MDRKQLSDWVGEYVCLWRTPGTDGLGALFAEDALYSMGPFERAARGIAEIERLWEEERLGPDEDFALDSEIVAVEGDTGVVRLEVRYGPPREQLYRDLWVVRLDGEGRCTSFEEWPHWPPGTPGMH